MTLKGFVKDLPAPVRALIQPMWYLSLGLHGLLLMMPMPSKTDTNPSARKKETVKLAKLSVPPVPKSSPVVNPPLPSPVVQQSSVVSMLPQVKPQPPKQNRIIESPQPSLVVKPNIPSPTPIASPTFTPTPTPIATPTPTPTPIASATPTPSPTATPTASPSPSPTPTPIASATPTSSPTPTPSPSPTNPFAGIPELAGVKQGCNGQQDCWQVEGSNMRSLANSIEPFLSAKGYKLLGQEDIADDTGRSLYRVSNKDNQIEYLHLISTDKGPVLLLGEKDLTREQLLAKATS